MRTVSLLALAILALPSGVEARTRKVDTALTPIPGAKMESCIPLTGIHETRVRDDSTIDFYVTGGKVYRNSLPHACPTLGFERAFGYATSLSQLCSTDIITVIRQGGVQIPGASCGLGEFQPMQTTRVE